MNQSILSDTEKAAHSGAFPGVSLISLEEDSILSSRDLNNAELAFILTVKAAFGGAILE